MVGSASSPVCIHELCLFCSSAVLCCNDQREEETTTERKKKKGGPRKNLFKCLAAFSSPSRLSFSRSVNTYYRPSVEAITHLYGLNPFKRVIMLSVTNAKKKYKSGLKEVKHVHALSCAPVFLVFSVARLGFKVARITPWLPVFFLSPPALSRCFVGRQEKAV